MPQYISKLILNGVTQMDVTQDTVTAAHLESNYTAHDASGAVITGSLTPSASTDYIVTLSYNSQTEIWEPDQTFAAIASAYAAGKTIVISGYEDAPADGYFNDGVPCFVYTVYYLLDGVIYTDYYVYTASGAELDDRGVFEYTNLQSKSVTFTPTASQQTSAVTADTAQGYTSLSQVNVTVNAAPAAECSVIVGTDDNFYTQNNQRFWEARGTLLVDDAGWVSSDISGNWRTFNAVASGTTITPSTQSQTIGGSKYMMEGAVTVAAMPSGSATPAASISGTSATISTGTNTLTLSKTVSNTPQVSAGYVSSGTEGNTSVSLTASVTTQAAQTIYPSSSDQTIASGKYLTGTQTIKAVTTTNLTADNIKSGVTVQIGDSADSDRVASVTGTYSGGGSSKNIQAYIGYDTRRANSYGATGVTLTVAKTGTYTISWCAARGSSSGTMGTNLHIGSTDGTNEQTWTGTYWQNIKYTGRSLTQNQVLTVYATSGSNSRSVYVGNLVIEEE